MKVYDSQGRLKTIAAGASVEPTSGQFSALSNQVSVADAALSAAINVVSNGLSNLTSLHDVLSNRVSANSATGGAGSVTSTEASAISAQAASAINVVSNAVSNEISNRVSADNVLSIAINVVSNAVSVVSVAAAAAEVHASTASAAATSADAHANTVSARVVSVSAELASLIQIASAAATSADGHANTVSARVVSVSAELASLVQIASAAATSVDGRVNSVNVFISGISARSVGGVSTHGFQSVVNALSGRIDAVTGGSVTSNELSAASAQAASAINVVSARVVSVSAELASLVQIASAAATSADAHANTVSAAANTISARVVSVSAELASLVQIASAAATSADAHANTASAAATSVDARVNSVNVFISGISAISVGGISTHGLQSVINALSNRISAVVAGAASVTSTEASAISATAAANLSADHFISLQNVDTVSLVYGMPVYAFTSADTMKRANTSVFDSRETQVLGLVADTAIAVSAIGMVRTRGSMVFTSAQIRSVAATASAFVIGSNYYLTGLGEIQAAQPSGNVGLAKVGVAINTRTLLVQAGLLPADQNLSNKISVLSQQASVTSAKLVSVSAQLTSIDGRLNVVSADSITGSVQGLQSAFIAVSDKISHEISVRSAADATMSVNIVSLQSTVSHLASIVSLVSAVSGGGTAVGLQSVINALSNRISAIPGGGSTNAVARVSVANVICAAALTDISGLTVSVSAGIVYKLEGMIMYSVSAGTGNAFGLTFPAMTKAGGRFFGETSVPLTGASTISSYIGGPFDEGDSGSAVWSAAVGATGTHVINVEGVLVVAAGGIIVPQARASVATNAVTIQAGSYMRVFKLS